MKQSYCLPIIKSTKNEVLQALHTKGYDYFEVWADYIDDLDKPFVEELIRSLQRRLILVFRRKNLEKVKTDLKRRLNITSILDNSQSFLDLDVFDQREELDHIKSYQLEVRTIVSYHDYEETPQDEKLKEIIDTIQIYKPEIIKISALCNYQKDALRLLQLLLELKEKQVKYIVLGMGELGVITRIFGTLWGNEMIYAPKIITEQSAPGQLTREQLKRIFTVL